MVQGLKEIKEQALTEEPRAVTTSTTHDLFLSSRMEGQVCRHVIDFAVEYCPCIVITLVFFDIFQCVTAKRINTLNNMNE